MAMVSIPMDPLPTQWSLAEAFLYYILQVATATDSVIYGFHSVYIRIYVHCNSTTTDEQPEIAAL